MVWTKLKTAVVVGIVMLAGAGGTVVTMKKIQQRREEAVWTPLTRLLDELANKHGLPDAERREWNSLPATVLVRPTHFGGRFGNEPFIRGGKNNRMVGVRMPAEALLVHTYEIGRMRIVNREALPTGKYDFFVSVPNRSEAMQAEIKRQLGLTIKTEMIQTNVYLLTMARLDAPGLKPAIPGAAKAPKKAGHVNFADIDSVRQFAELRLKTPVINTTGLTNRYDIDFEWDQNEKNTDTEALKQNLLEQLGVNLTLTNQTIQMVVWKK